ncbi:MAG: GntR family transcriptional regulator [Holophaga sp.]|nr:GntR family transcriptional regulator [Holophaga sp.]
MPSASSSFPQKKLTLQTRSLREQVYDYLRAEMNSGGMQPGSFLDINALAGELGISRTPLRDALLQLEVEGFVEILPRRGFRLKSLGLAEIRNIYQIIGALEAAVLVAVGPCLGPDGLARMDAHNEAMRGAIVKDDFESFFNHNLAFHAEYLDISDNPRLTAHLHSLKQRLYDWPRRKAFANNWEEGAILEHAHLLKLIRNEEFQSAATYIREVLWSFEAQEAFIRVYYQTGRAE